MSKRMMGHKNAQIRLEALDGFVPKTQREMHYVFKLLKKEKDSGVKKKAAIVLLNTKNKEIINSLGKRVISLEDGKLVRDEKKGRFIL